MKYFQYTLLTAFIALVGLFSAQAQVTILSEDLRGGSLPVDWTSTDVTFSTAAGGYANVSGTTGELTTPVIDLTGYTDVELYFSVAKFGTGVDGPITVEISDDGGATFTAQTYDSPVPTSGTYLDAGPTSITASGSNVVIRLSAVNSPSNKRVRDFALTGILPGAVLGCTNDLACNFDVLANTDDGSCELPGDPCDDGDATTENDVIQGDCTCAGTLIPPPPSIVLHVLNDGDYTLNEWAASELAETYPASMQFFFSIDPGNLAYDRTLEGTGLYDCSYAGGTRCRVNGKDADGFSFFNTGSAQYDDCVSGSASTDRFVGSALLGLNTQSVTYARAEWVARTVIRNGRDYAARLQYRIGDTGAFTDFDATTLYSVVGTVDGDSESFSFDLPANLLGEAEVYLRWVYYQLEGSATGARPEIAVDDILITTNETVVINGCTDALACNYDETATSDDGSCFFVGDACDDANNATVNDVINALCECEGTPIALPNLVINEIHYNPCQAQGPDNEFEFVEIYNGESEAVDLSDYTLSGSINFTFPLGTSIAAGEYIVVAVLSTSYAGNGYQVFQWDSGALGNSGGTVTLSNADAITVDTVAYDEAAPWPTSPNGGCPSLELISPELDNSDPANWQASFVANGTPGAENSTPPPGVSYTIVEIQSDVDAGGGSVLVGEVVNTQGIVTGLFPGINYYTIQDGAGPWTGIWVQGSGVEIGDEVEIVGTVSEQFGLTRIVSVTSVDVLTQGNPLPAFQPLFTTDINQEQWEGVLLEITGIVTNGDAGFGEWLLDDGSGQARVDNIGVDVVPVDEGVQFTVYGPLYYSFGNFKMAPRDLNDILRWGCTDDTFANYDPLALINDGSCSNAEGCTNPIADNYDPAAVIDDGSCFIAGCTDPLALNYNAEADEDDGSCYFVLPNLVINEIHYNPCNFQGSDFDYEFIEIYNNDMMTVDLSGFELTGSAQFTFPEGAEIAAGEYILIAVNAPFYEGNLYQVFEWTNGNLGNDSGNVTLSDAFGNVIGSVAYLSGAPWPEAAGGDCSSLELIDPSLDPSDPNNWQASYVLFGTPGAQNSQNVAGCMNPFACNYNAAASSDDGSCDFESCFGCTYELAMNYDAIASVDDGSCEFNLEDDCPADLNDDGLINAADLSIFLSAFGTACP